MADTIRSTDDFLNASTGLFKDNTAGDISAQDLRDFVLSTYRPQAFCMGRLTLESGVAVSTSDQTAKTSVYFTPHNGNLIGIYDGTSWELRTFTELTLALGTLSDATNYDVFIYDNAGTLTLEATGWTNATTRATALTLQDGVYVKSGATTRRYLGTFRTTSTTTTEDSAGGSTTQVGGKRFLWNAYNRVHRPIRVMDTTNSWTYSDAAYRQANAATGNKVEVVCGVAEALLDITAGAFATTASGPVGVRVGIGEDATNAQANDSFWVAGVPSSGEFSNTIAYLRKQVAIGYHYYAWIESGGGTSTQTWYGDNAGDDKTGLTGTWEC